MLEVLRLTPFGAFHTAIGLIAVVSGLIALVRDGKISTSNSTGMLYVAATFFACVTGLFIFHHGGFGKPHVLSILTMLVLGVAALARYTATFGRFSRNVEMVSYSATFFFHFIPALTETLTRLPLGAPLYRDADAPGLKMIFGALFVLFLIGSTLQVRYVRASGSARNSKLT